MWRWELLPRAARPDISLFRSTSKWPILFRQGDTLNIGRIFIDPQHFRKGYGILMMREIEALYPDVRVFTLDTPVWNKRTNAFYTGLGYSVVKRDTDFVYYSKKR